jgi:hypothetical protein
MTVLRGKFRLGRGLAALEMCTNCILFMDCAFSLLHNLVSYFIMYRVRFLFYGGFFYFYLLLPVWDDAALETQPWAGDGAEYKQDVLR